MIVSFCLTPDVPSSKVIGKSPEYAASYHDSYEATAKKERETKAVIGCCTTMAVYAIIEVIAAAAVTTTTANNINNMNNP